MVKGKVEWYNSGEGFGFLQVETGEYVFCHGSSILGRSYNDLAAGDSVTFDVVKGLRGLEAENVIRL